MRPSRLRKLSRGAYSTSSPGVFRSQARGRLGSDNVQLTALIGFIISAALMLVLIGFVLYPLVAILAVVLHVIALLKANRGEWWRPPLTLPIFR